MIQLIKRDLIEFNKKQVKSVIRDEGLLDSAVSNPFQSFAGNDLYPSLIDKVAQLMFGIITNHPFVDGNKRTSVQAALVMLYVNNREVKCSDKDLFDITIKLASGKASKDQLVDFLNKNVVIISKGDQ